PFYFANFQAFGNPVWPLLVSAANGAVPYADQVAAAWTVRMTGRYEPAYVAARVGEVVSSPSIFPLAFGLVLLIPLSLRARNARYRSAAILGALYLVLWLIMEPRLFPRYILLLLPVGALLFVPALDGLWCRPR